ncbi:MAG: DUF6114 domain-containing protein [Candidatus Bipolaricaulaceae bacterium]
MRWTFWDGRPWIWPRLVLGILILIGAAFLFSRPKQARPWGIVILVCASLSVFFGMGGIIAGLLGIIGGALAIAWSPGETEGK